VHRFAMGLCVVAIALVGAACGSSKHNTTTSAPAATTQATTTPGATGTTGSTHFAKTKFALHAGLAFGAFHRWIYKPYKAGVFHHPTQHKAAMVKAGLAAAFAYHEVRLALDDARSSKILSAALAPLLTLQTKLSSLANSFNSGHLDTATIESAKSDSDSISSVGAAAGQPVHQLPPPSF
jgi:hypothetical protein